MKKVLTISLIVVASIVILFSVLILRFINPSLPVYPRTDENGIRDDDGIIVVVEGIEYKMLPELKWAVTPGRTAIGYAGDYKTVLIAAANDTNRTFLYSKGVFADYYDGVLCRTDIDIPEPSAESVDKLIWNEYVIGGENKYENIVDDKEIISQLFELIVAGEKTTQYHGVENDSGILYITINCQSSALPGASYRLDIGINDGEIICGNRSEGEFAQIPIGLLEEISGKKIDIREALPVCKYSDGNIYIDEIEYTQLSPYLKWRVDTDNAEPIGYYGYSNNLIKVNPDDTERNFVFVDDRSTTKPIDYWPYHRTDKDIPDVSIESVDKIVWVDNKTGSTYVNTTEDKRIITTLFNQLDSIDWVSGSSDEGFEDNIAALDIDIKLYSSELQGVYFPLKLWIYNDKIICRNLIGYYVYVSEDLVNYIAGEQIDFTDYLESS